MSRSVVQIPSGLADPPHRVAVVVTSEGLMECLNLEDGQPLAKSDFAAAPLAIFRGAIIGWRQDGERPDGVSLFLASRQGGSLHPLWQTPLPLPAWVETDSPHPEAFNIQALVEDDLVRLSWEAHSRYRAGPAPPADRESAERHDERHVLQLDGETGAILRQEQSNPSHRASRPDQDLPILRAGDSLVAYQFDQRWFTHPWQAGSSRHYLVRSSTNTGVFLVREPLAGSPNATRSLLSTNDGAIVLRTLDQGHLLIHDPATKSQLSRIVSHSSGDEVARFETDLEVDNATILDGVVLYSGKRQEGGLLVGYLQSRDLNNAHLLWSHSLGTEGRSQPPPLPQ